ncbi:isocyanide synthase family protein [Flexivirga meconopsidis]|uniref:isocyanide synthase family protein n=1 Tax=Flexivirga meconopsidis TaxID=2977121 RepID=UPI00223F3582|nr:isocyanide synthase family protein [Flexivirga meconopsidis]
MTSADDVARAILQILLPHRRHLPHEPRATPDDLQPQLRRLTRTVRSGRPVHFTLPGFPCKSPNPAKVLGSLPDEGERLALHFLDRLCRDVELVHPPGARLTVCSDGHVFSDAIRVSDNTIRAYRRRLDSMIAGTSDLIDTFDLADAGFAGLASRREKLLSERAPHVEQLRAHVRSDETAAQHYRGITRFLVEDTPRHDGTKSALQRDCRRRAYDVIRRSIAWGSLVDETFPDAVRLSIHPQPIGSAKLGIRLLDSPDAWATPWHTCVLRGPDGTRLLPHHEARRHGRLVRRDGVPSHFVAR